MYCDASTRFQKDIFRLHGLVHQTGIVVRKTLSPISAWTHPKTFRIFGQEPESFRYVQMAAAGVLLIEKKDFIVERVIKPWVQCALHEECIAPAGLHYPPCPRGKHSFDFRCHRFDQSALNILLYRIFTNNRLYPAMTAALSRTAGTIRHATKKFQVKTC